MENVYLLTVTNVTYRYKIPMNNNRYLPLLMIFCKEEAVKRRRE